MSRNVCAIFKWKKYEMFQIKIGNVFFQKKHFAERKNKVIKIRTTCKNIEKKKKKHLSNFSTLSTDDMKTEKTNIFCWYKNTKTQQ